MKKESGQSQNIEKIPNDLVESWQETAEKKRDYFRRMHQIYMRLGGPSRKQLHEEGYFDEDIKNDMGLSLSVIDEDEIISLTKALDEESEEYFQEFGEKYPGDYTLSQAIKALPHSIGKRLDAHGIDRGNELQSLVNLLTNGIGDGAFHTMELKHDLSSYGMGATMPKTEGDIIIVGPMNHSGSGERKMIYDPVFRKTNISYVVLGRAYYQITEDLQKYFPDVKVITANKIEDSLIKDLPFFDKFFMKARRLFQK